MEVFFLLSFVYAQFKNKYTRLKKTKRKKPYESCNVTRFLRINEWTNSSRKNVAPKEKTEKNWEKKLNK